MEIVSFNYRAQLGLFDNDDMMRDDEDYDSRRYSDAAASRQALFEDDDCLAALPSCGTYTTPSGSIVSIDARCLLLSIPTLCGLIQARTGVALSAVAALLMLLLLVGYVVVTTVPQTASLGESVDWAKPRAGIDTNRAHDILSQLCQAYDRDIVSGDSCSRLCYDRNWEINDFYEGNKVVIVLKEGGQLSVFKSAHWSLRHFPAPDSKLTQDEFSDKVLDLVNDQLRLGWPREFKKHLMDTVWPTLLRTPGEPMTQADRLSLWSLLQQPEFVLFRVLPLTRVTPKLIGSCGHFYETESLVAFRMKKYYMNLKGKILVHLMGTLKLLYEFLNEPLQWCDVRFDNLGLSADYPKRFVLMDGDEVYTQSRLSSLLKGRPCETDADCTIGDCTSRCTDTLTCSDRTNSNLEVFCEKLVHKLYGTTWSKNNRYLAACNDPAMNVTQRLQDLRLTWSWNLSDV